MQLTYPRGFAGLSKIHGDILGKLDLAGVSREGITERACLMLASAPPVWAFPGAPGHHRGSPRDSSCTADLLGQEA